MAMRLGGGGAFMLRLHNSPDTNNEYFVSVTVAARRAIVFCMPVLRGIRNQPGIAVSRMAARAGIGP